MTEIEKMRNGLLADFTDPAIQESLKHAKFLLNKLGSINNFHEDYRTIIEELIPNFPKTSTILPPFYCDHGHGIVVGEHVFVNANCTFLDGGRITIGKHTLIGPNVQIYTPNHPFDHVERRRAVETSYPVTIGEDCWIGGGAIITPGVTIGDRTIVGAGSVVTKDLPPDCVAVGNPAKVIRKKK